LVDLDDGQVRLFTEPNVTPGFDEPGVPYWLRGRALAWWVREEAVCPADDKINWQIYRSE
jgi:hypothetical protein